MFKYSSPVYYFYMVSSNAEETKFEIDWNKTKWDLQEDFESKAIEALSPIKNDALYIAQLLRKYDVQENNYSSLKSLQEMVAPATPLEQELQKYNQAHKAISEVLANSDLPLGALFNMKNSLIDLYFNSQYQLPQLD